MNWQCRMAPSLGGLENTPEEVWGTKPYINRKDSTVFFGLYDMRDYLALYFHRGVKMILWAGGDIENLLNGFVLNDGKLKWLSRACGGAPKRLIRMLAKVPNYVENDVEKAKLESLGIPSKVVPSFLGKIEDFPICYKQSKRPQVFVSGHYGREKEYGFYDILEVARKVTECDFHFYGSEYIQRVSTKYFGMPDVPENVINHGLVTKEQFNREIKNYHCGLRPNTHDGFSEITAKSILMGQYPITRIKYNGIDQYKDEHGLVLLLKSLKSREYPNFDVRELYLKILNQYPWNKYANTKKT